MMNNINAKENKRYRFLRKKENLFNLVLLMLFAIYPLFLFQYNFPIISAKGAILTLLCAFASFWGFYFNGIKLKAKTITIKSQIDIILLLISVLLFTFLLIDFPVNNQANSVRFESSLFNLLFIFLYFAISAKPTFYQYYFKLLTYSGLLVYGGMLYHYMCDITFTAPIELIITNKETMASYVMLTNTISILLYCHCKDKLQSVCYLLISAIGFFILFINQHLISIYLMLFVFLLIPGLHIPTAELIKRAMQMFFLYAFLLSNMSLITQYTNILLVETRYELIGSIYLDIIIAVAAYLFFRYWENIPREADKSRLVLKRMRKGYLFFVELLGLFFLIFIIGTDSWKQEEKKGISQLIGELRKRIGEDMQNSTNTFQQAFHLYGIVGVIIISIILLLLINQLKRNYSVNKPLTVNLLIISCVYIASFLFFKQQLVSSPLYAVILIYACFFQEKERTYHLEPYSMQSRLKEEKN